MAKRIVGIDFGTSTSVIKVKTYTTGNKPLKEEDAVFTNSVKFDHKDAVPTLVCEVEKGGKIEYLCGDKVKNKPKNGKVYANFKMDLISQDAEKRSRAKFLILKFFKYLYQTYREQDSHFPACTSEYTYISYPAKWTEAEQNLMKDIAKEVGFKNVEDCNEPTAAIHTVMIQEIDGIQKNKLLLPGESAYILIIDLGAGTTDLALCKYTLDKVTEPEILMTWPTVDNPSLFGGREIDQKLCEYIRDYLQKCGSKKLDKFVSLDNMNNCKTWKESYISPILDRNHMVPSPGFMDIYTDNLPMNVEEFPEIDRQTFETTISENIGQFANMITECIERTKNLEKGFRGAEDLDFVILTGGHSQWYFIENILLGEPCIGVKNQIRLPKIQNQPERLIRLSKPQETAALGLVYQPMNLPIKICAANSVWVHFEIDTQKSDIVKVIEHGEVLPYVNRFTAYIALTQSVVREDNSFKCFKRSGQEYETALPSSISQTLFKNTSTKVWDWFRDFWKDEDTKIFAIFYTVRVGENQISEIEGYISAEGYKSSSFKFSAF